MFLPRQEAADREDRDALLEDRADNQWSAVHWRPVLRRCIFAALLGGCAVAFLPWAAHRVEASYRVPVRVSPGLASEEIVEDIVVSEGLNQVIEEGPVAGYSWLGRGYCSQGFYAGLIYWEASDLAACVALCNAEERCDFFSLVIGVTCSRYHAGNCSRYDKDAFAAAHSTFAKQAGQNASLPVTRNKTQEKETTPEVKTSTPTGTTTSTMSSTDTTTSSMTVTYVNESAASDLEAYTTTRPPPAYLRHPNSMYCWLLARAHTYEVKLVQASFVRNEGIFRCDGHDVLADYWFDVGDKSSVTELGDVKSDSAWWGSVMNGLPFVHAWNRLLKVGRYWKYSWTVKVDPDAVFLPDRLRGHLKNLPSSEACWVRNWDQKFGLLGPIEIFSALAVDVYAARKDECLGEYVAKSGEDGFIGTCMNNILQVKSFLDLGVLDGRGDLGKCWENPGTPAMHPFKDPHKFEQCLDAAISVR